MYRFLTCLMTATVMVACGVKDKRPSSISSVEAYGGNLISCALQEAFDCSFNEFFLDTTTYPHEMRFEIDASFRCGSAGHPQDYFVGFFSESDQIFTEMPRFGRDGAPHQTIVARGKGPLKFYDSDKTWTKGSPKYERDCTIVVHELVSRDISDGTKAILREIVGKSLGPLQLDYSRAASISSLVALLDSSLTKLDLASVKGLFTNFKSNLEALKVSQGIQGDWAPVFTEIDLVLALNPAVDPEVKSHVAVEKALVSIRDNNEAMLKSIAMRLGKYLADADEVLMFAREGSVAEERAQIDVIKKQITR
ncbi:MAG: hypothetical protein FJ146_08735 [Deltaproteobacteria bacterium]|nr:hypothetical protein [Deltaproteobacteria bacterium]